MTKKTHSVLLFLAVIVACGSVFAFDYKEADSLFGQRENNLSNITQARALYREALRKTQGDDKVYAVEQLAKLAYYEGDLLTDEKDSTKRVDIFQQCQDDVEEVSPAKMEGQEYAAYYYWKSACMALWAKSAGSFSVLARVSDLEAAMYRGAEVDGSFAGGGVHRVMGSVYLKSKAMRWIPGLSRFYDPDKALVHIDKAISFGPEYYVAYLVKAEILKELKRGKEGLTLLKQKHDELSVRVRKNDLPDDLKPESKVILQQMSDLIDNW